MKATVNNMEFDIEKSDDGLTFMVNNKLNDADIQSLGNNSFHILWHNKGYRAEVMTIDRAEKKVTMKINGQRYEVKLNDRFDALLHEMGFDKLVATKVLDIKAPMPGLVVKVLIEKGMQVNEGDSLLILEAMKMENVIKAAGTATVTSVNIKPGQKVEKGELLIGLS
jgi:biotin carboxyl carrier protein